MKNSENVSAFHDQKVSSAIINGLPHTWKPESEPGAMRMPDFRLMRDADPLEQRLCQVWVPDYSHRQACGSSQQRRYKNALYYEFFHVSFLFTEYRILSVSNERL